MPTYGFKVARLGFNVLTTDELVFSSEFLDSFKIKYSGSTTVVVPAGATSSTTYVHNYGVRPSFVVYYKDPTDNKYLLSSGNNNSWWILPSSNIYCTTRVATTTITFFIRNNTASQVSVPIYFDLFYEADGEIQ
ncbi:MAG: hypothetical protein M0Q27_03520 [Candidatus Colwellbacteria bacterium]|nr:hypothetical protein [Candidatus Colwellbacteria bacterium]